MFKVKASFDYSSPHEDDLSFKAGQIITVTEQEGDDWYVGEYIDDTGTKHDGLFPTNFVEKYEPEPPPRPNRASRYKPMEPPQPQVQQASAPPPMPEPSHPEPEPEPEPQPVQHTEPEPQPQPQPPPQLSSPPPAQPDPTPISPPSATSTRAPELPRAQLQQEAAKPPPPAKKAPPPVAAKSNAFRDRIAAFNAPAAAPIQPFKPGGGSTTFIKKPFVAPPPSRNAYVPPPVRETPHATTYRREEDPEIAERQAQDQDAAERAGFIGHGPSATNEGADEDQPKPTSLKERIALLQKQQQEQAERAAAAMHKEKPKRPPVKKRTESHEGHAEDSEDTGLDRIASGSSRDRASIDHARPPRTPHDVKSPDFHHHNRDIHSDANDADQSGAGETEDAEGESTSVDDDEERARTRQPSTSLRAPAAPSQEPDVGDEQDVEEEEEEEEDEMDAETRRKLELRERMAKMSGGMGMPGMFGGIPMGGLPPKKKKPAPEKKVEEEDEYASAPRIPMFAMPGMPTRAPVVEKEEEPSHPITSTHTADEVPDVEDITPSPIQRTPTGERPPPIPSDRRPLPPPVPSASRPVPPPIPSVTSPGPGSESGDEMTDDAPNAMSPRTPSAPFPPPPKRSSYIATDDSSQSPLERRVPSMPLTSPTSASGHRLPPPLPPTQAPPPHLRSRPMDKTEGETDYEGDYDTDIAPGATHKDALKSHSREPSMDDSTAGETAPYAPPPLPPTAPRAVPPPPPSQAPSRHSMDAPRMMPPVPPVPPPTRNTVREEDDEDYDPYRYNSLNAAPPVPRAAPPPPQSQPPVPQNRPPPPMPPGVPPVPQQQAAESSDEDDLYSSPPPRKSHDRPPPPPPQAPPPHQHAPPPPPPQERAAPPPPPQDRAVPLPAPSELNWAPSGKKSMDVSRTMGSRTSSDVARSAVNQDFIASDMDLGATSHWWTQPKLLPPALQNRKDVLINMKESQSGSSVEKLISVLYLDYSQTTVSARFELSNVSDVQLEQRHDPPPGRLRPDQLENAYEQFGRRIAKDIESKQNTVVGNGTPQGLIEELLKPYPDALAPVSTRAYGALVYANLANASTQSFDEIRPGDIISFRNVKFQGKTGPMHAKYAVDVGKPDHVGVVVEWDGSKKKVRVWEQGREHKKVKPESFKMGDLRSGEVRVWRVMSKNWVGWS